MAVATQVGTYRLLQQIGKGGMGTVWLAEHVILRRRAAIKLLLPAYAARPDVVIRFFNEARAATAIADPGIVQIFDFGYHVDGSPYIAMEMLDGEPLDRRLRRLGRLPIGDALRILRQVASTLGVVHASGIVHRDLKPENVFLVRDPEVIGGERAKILDFGIAKLTCDPGIQTNADAVLGTPTYMAPEQCRGAAQVDARADVYAVGCMMFALITGRPPFQAESAGALIAMHLREPPPRPSSLERGIPLEVEALVLRCLAKDLAYRPASGAELAAALGVLASATRTASVEPSDPVPLRDPPMNLALKPMSPMHHAAVSRQRVNPRRAAVVALSVLVMGGGIVAAVFRGDAPAATHPPPAAVAPDNAVARSAPVSLSPTERSATASVNAPASPAPRDPRADIAEQMKAMLAKFTAWSHDHTGAHCPSGTELGTAMTDPWGHALVITCTEQPADQRIGVISVGRDGERGTADDVASWQVGHEVTDLVHGTRWGAAPARPGKTRAAPSHFDDDIPKER